MANRRRAPDSRRPVQPIHAANTISSSPPRPIASPKSLVPGSLKPPVTLGHLLFHVLKPGIRECSCHFFSILSLFLRFESLIPVLYGLLMFLFKGGWQWTVGIGDRAICLLFSNYSQVHEKSSTPRKTMIPPGLFESFLGLLTRFGVFQ